MWWETLKRGKYLFILLGVGITILATKLAGWPYDVENYRSTLSTTLQILGTIFALFASSLILLLQSQGQNSPMSLKFFPRSKITTALFTMVIVLVLDGLFLLFLPEERSKIQLIFCNLLLVGNAVSCMYTVYFVLTIVNWLRPETIIDIIIRNCSEAQKNDLRLEAIYALEEMSYNMIQRGYRGSGKLIINAYRKLFDYIVNNHTHLNTRREVNMNPYHPLRQMTDSMSRVAIHFLKNDMSDLMHFFGWNYGDMVGYKLIDEESKDADDDFLQFEVKLSVLEIIEYCLINGEDVAMSNLVANLSVSQKSSKGKNGMIYILSEIGEKAVEYEHHQTVYKALDGIVRLCQKLEGKITRKVFVNKFVSAVNDKRAILNKTGRHTSVTIRDKVTQLTALLEKSKLTEGGE